MSWTSPWLLAALAALPLLYWLLRALPPSPRVQDFPALRLLAGLAPPRETVARASPWLLALRIVAFGLLTIGLAGPLLHADQGPQATIGQADTVIVIDNGWASAADWTERRQAAEAAIATLERTGHDGWLLGSADPVPAARAASPPLPPATLRGGLAAMHPQAWPPDRAALARRLAALPASASVLYLADGVATGDDPALNTALRRFAHLVTLRDPAADPLLIGPPRTSADRLEISLLRLPGHARARRIEARDEDGGTLATATSDAGNTAVFTLPAELRNRIARLVIPGLGAGGVRLLDESTRRRPVGLLGTETEDTPLLGRLYYLRRALAEGSELREGDLSSLLSRELSVIIAPDGTVASLSDSDRKRLAAWVEAGGMLIRFAGPLLASHAGDPADSGPEAAPAFSPADSLLPVPLLGGARELGGAMSWETAQSLAPWPATSPFAGLPAPADVRIRKQVLAAPSGALDAASWARLADGTPLVTHLALGRGQLVLFAVTSNADWSDLPLSGVFPLMLHRLIERATGFATQGDAGGRALLAPALSLDGSGSLATPPPGAQALQADRFGLTPATSLHPPGLYGPASARRALNLADTRAALAPQTLPGPGESLAATRATARLGPWLAAIGLVLLAIDQLAVLVLRGWRPWRRGAAIALVLLAAIAPAHAQTAPTQDSPELPQGALHTTLAYIRTGDPARDETLREGLAGLAAYTSARTSAAIAPPVAVTPGIDDLAYYPLIYWAVDDTPPDPKAITALNAYLAHGGMLLIDSHAGDAALSPEALHRATDGLDIPALAKLDDHQVLAHTFYLLHDFPGRWADAPVWIAAAAVSSEDGIVSPVVIGAGGWAQAWAVDAQGQTPFAAIPGGEDQRRTAYRFGVNLLIYALTGTYKADQAKVPALLERLGQ